MRAAVGEVCLNKIQIAVAVHINKHQLLNAIERRVGGPGMHKAAIAIVDVQARGIVSKDQIEQAVGGDIADRSAAWPGGQAAVPNRQRAWRAVVVLVHARLKVDPLGNGDVLPSITVKTADCYAV